MSGVLAIALHMFAISMRKISRSFLMKLSLSSVHKIFITTLTTGHTERVKLTLNSYE